MEKDIRILKAAVVALVLTAGFWFLIQTGGVILGAALPVVLGALVACVFFALTDLYSGQLFRKEPVQSQRTKVLPVVAAAITAVAIIVFLAIFVLPQLVSSGETLVSNAPAAVNLILSNPTVIKLLPKDIAVQLQSIDWVSIINEGKQALLGGLWNNAGSIANAVSSVLTGVSTLVMSLLFAAMFISGRKRINHKMQTICLHHCSQEIAQRVLHIAQTVSSCFKTYFAGRLMIALPTGILCLVVMLLLGLPYAPMISVLLGVCALIPVFGGYIGAILGAFMILPVSAPQAVIFLILSLILQVIGNLTEGRINRKKAGMSALLTMTALTIGGSLGGILGIIIAVPLTAALYHLLTE